VGLAFAPGLVVTLEDVRIRNRGMEVASATQARLAIALLPLLRNEVRVEKISLKLPRVSIERDRQGRFNFETPEVAAEALPTLDWPNVILTDATFVYVDRRSGDVVDAARCQLDLHRLRLPGGARSTLLRALSFTAELACAQVRGDGFTLSDLRLSAEAKSGVLELKPVTTRVFGTQGSGSVRADLSAAVPSYAIDYALAQFPIEEFFKTLTPKKVAVGRMDFSANVSMQGTSAKELRQTIGPRLAARQEPRSRRRRSGWIPLPVRIQPELQPGRRGGPLLCRALGLVLTRGYSFASLLQESRTASEIRTLVSEWKVERGVAHAQDVAMATKANRIALQGGLDFVGDRFDEVTLAVIDAQGCAKVKQKIHGTFQNPWWTSRISSRPWPGRRSACWRRGATSSAAIATCSTPARWRRRHDGSRLRIAVDDDQDAGAVLDAAQTTDGLRYVRWRTECGQRQV
jgi:AsmA protein